MRSPLLTIHVKPGTGKNEVAEIKPEFIKIKISAPPEKGRANAELVKFLSKILDINKNEIEIVSGNNSKIKMVKVNNLTVEEVIKRLQNEIR